MSELPTGWATATVADLGSPGEQAVLTGPFGSHLSSSDFTSIGVPLLTIGCLTDGGVSLTKAMHVSEAKAEDLGRYRLGFGDMLFSRMASVGRAGFVTEALEGALFNYHLMRLRLDPTIYLPSLFLAFVRGAPEVRQYLDEVNHGATRDGINTEQLLGMPVLVPPLNEQRRIVEKLDAVFNRSRAAKSHLERLPALLEKLKRSILAAAFRGDLTKDWRAANPDVEPASVLLERIRAERREDRVHAKGKAAKKATYGEAAPIDIDALPDLPKGWAWTTIGEVSPLQPGYAFSSKAFRPSGVRLLKGINVRDGWLSNDEVNHWDAADTADYASFVLAAGDVVLAMDRPVYSSGSRATKVAVLDESWAGALLLQRVGRFRATSAIDKAYLFAHVEGPDFREHIIRGQKGTQDGKDLPHVSGSTVDAAVIPLPPLSEQIEVARILADVRAFLTRQERRGEFLSTAVARLEQAALAKAFRGELVPQDPNDEPASVLLERIRAARTDEPQRARRSRTARVPEASSSKSPNVKRANGHDITAEPAPVALVVAAFQQQGPKLTATAIGETTGLDAASVKRALNALADAGQVRVEGKARGREYVWSGG